MTILPFRQELYDNSYRVMAGTDEWTDSLTIYKGTELKMEQVWHGVLRDRPIGQSLNDLAEIAKIDEDMDDKDFCASYRKIFRGEREDWKLTAFEVSFQEIILWYAKQTGGDGHITITDPCNLYLKFTAPRSKLGFDPTYTIEISCQPDGLNNRTHIVEDLGYIMYDRWIIKKSERCATDESSRKNIYMEGEIYTGI